MAELRPASEIGHLCVADLCYNIDLAIALKLRVTAAVEADRRDVWRAAAAEIRQRAFVYQTTGQRWMASSHVTLANAELRCADVLSDVAAALERLAEERPTDAT